MTTETTSGQSADEDVAQVMSAAQAYHDAGRLREAEALYRQVLRTWPDHPDALHLMGMLAYQVGRSDVAVELINKAIATRPSDAEFYHDLGNVLQAQGKAADALACFRKALLLKPDHVDAHFNLGAVLHARGRLDEAAASYADALAIDPDLAEAHNNLGIILQQQGRLDEAIESYRKALARNPDSADWNYNLGNALRDQGSLAQAAESYRKTLAIRPDHASAHNNLGAVLQRQGHVDEAIDSYRKALSFKPGYADAHCNLGSALQSLAKSDEAIASFRTALSFEPNHAIAYNELGRALAGQGRLDESAESYRRALSIRADYVEAQNNLGIVEAQRGNLDAAGASFLAAATARPDFAEAHNNLGNVLNELGRPDAAIESFRRALEIREAPEFRMSFVRCVRTINPTAVDPELRRLVNRALAEPWARPSDLAGTAMKCIAMNPGIKECIDRVAHAWPHRLSRQELFGADGMQALVADPLVHTLLENAQVCELALERLFTTVRHVMLDVATQTVPGGDPEPATLAFYCAVARQCFLNEFVYSLVGDEDERARRLQERLVAALRSGEDIPAIWVAAVGAYFSLASGPFKDAPRPRTWPEPVAALLTQQIAEPHEERRLMQAMRRLTTVDDSVSRRVQRQYEENPYPRWVKLPAAGKGQALGAYLREQFPMAPFVPPGSSGALDILVAGCGTGQESIEMAQQFPDARVLAVDLSLASLAYATRKTAERGLANVEYAQGDITKLSSIGRTFDIISSVGVLHHLEDPMAGWRQLLSLLRPGGFMLLGFYSEQARRNVVAARAFIAEGGYGSTPAEMRRCREALTAPANAARFEQLTTFRDFYVTSEIRDLLFHVQEHRFALPQIEERLRELELDFVGFLVEPPVVRKYDQRFPDDRARTNLANWDAFEAEFPDTFISTYAFWVQKPAD